MNKAYDMKEYNKLPKIKPNSWKNVRSYLHSNYKLVTPC